jgi:hypothetical protein
MTTTAIFTIGQKVSFTSVRQVGKTIKFSSRNGVVEELNGDVAVVKMRNGSMHTANLSDLRAEGERSALTEAVLAGLDREPT